MTYSTLAAFTVPGAPAPQGSKTPMPNGALLEGSSATGRAKHQAWRETVAWHARQVAPSAPYDGALSLTVQFYFPMPRSRPARIRAVGLWPRTVKPDVDKLVRAVCDALVDGGLIRDDARIYHLDTDKWETTRPDLCGADIVLRRWEDR